MPFLLGCILLLIHWHKTDSFTKADWKHAVYGLCCMMGLLCRASDGIYVVLVYISLWIYHTYKYGIKTTIKQPIFCIGVGILPFAAFSLYFYKINAFSEFFYATISSNFGYMKHVEPEKFRLITICLFITIAASLFALSKKRRSLDKTKFMFYFIPYAIHIIFFCISPGFFQYIFSYIPDMIMTLYIISFEYKLKPGFDYKVMAFKYAICTIIGCAAMLIVM